MVIEYAQASSSSIFMLFIDLTQAFDRVMREIAFGWPQGSGLDACLRETQAEYLESIGVPLAIARKIVDHIRTHGDVLSQWNVDPVVHELVRGLHTHAWFRVEDSDSIVETMTGGRQGCKLGFLIFCAVYEQALFMMRDMLRQAGLSLKFRVATSRAFWSETDTSARDIDDSSVEVTYVDDEAAAIIAPTPAK